MVGQAIVERSARLEPGVLERDVARAEANSRIDPVFVRAVSERLRLDQLPARRPVVVFDELHKYGRWKQFLKGFFDTYEHRVRIIVTGSSRLDTYRRGGDSLMGRYFSYRMHPLSVGEQRDPVGEAAQTVDDGPHPCRC